MTKANGSSSTVQTSPARKKRQAAKRRAEERAWAAKASPVTVRRVGDTPERSAS